MLAIEAMIATKFNAAMDAIVQQGMDFFSLDMPLFLYFYETPYIICKLTATQGSLQITVIFCPIWTL